MPEKITFAVQPRTIAGKKVNQLRKGATIPGNISGDLEKPIAVVFDLVAFEHLYKQIGDTGLFYVKVEGDKKDHPVLVSEVQHDPISNKIMHVVFRQVNLSEKVHAEVPVVLIGETAVKNAIVATLHDAIEVSALPQDLPEHFEIDISQLTEIGQMVTFEQLNYDKSKVTLMVEQDQMATPVVMVQEVKEEKVEEAPVAAEGTEGAAAAPAEGAAPTAEKTEEKAA